MRQITIVNTGDYEAIYVDDVLFTEGYNVQWYEWLEIGVALATTNYVIESYELSEEVSDKEYSFPVRLSEIPQEYLI